MDGSELFSVDIHHPSGIVFELNLTAQEIEKFNNDSVYKEQLLKKYLELYDHGMVSGKNSQRTDEDFQQTESQANLGSSTWNAEDEEALIRLVSLRPALYDFRIPLKERSRTITRALWEEVILNLNVDMSVESIARKWKSLRDSFIRARANINKKIASGSSAEEKILAERIRKGHKHYDLLNSVLENTLSTRRTSSNLENMTVTDADSLDSVDQTNSTPSTSRGTSRPQSRSDSRNQLSLQDEMFIDAIKNLPGDNHTFSSIQNFCLRLADGLEKLPPRISNQLQLEFLTKLTEMENKYVYLD